MPRDLIITVAGLALVATLTGCGESAAAQDCATDTIDGRETTLCLDENGDISGIEIE